MSSGGEIRLAIMGVRALRKAIGDLKLAYQEKKAITTADGKIHKVDVVVKDDSGKDVGFQKQKDGAYKVIADSSGLTREECGKQTQFVNKIKRRYAYNMIIGELNKQGYQVVEEKKAAKDTVRLVARRWVT